MYTQILSDQELKVEIENQKQMYFVPDKSEGGVDMTTVKQLVECMLCNQIPLDQKACTTCKRIIC
jgi:hypothetical protein